MTTATKARPESSMSSTLKGQKLPRWALPVLFLGVLGLSFLLFELIDGLDGVANYIVFTAVLYVIAQTLLSFGVEGLRQAKNRLATTFVIMAFLLAVAPLVHIAYYTIERGAVALNMSFLNLSMLGINPSEDGGGAYHAIIGTLLIGLIAAVIAVPLGILTSVYLVEYGGNTRFGKAVSFFVDVMTGVPSIVAGLFIYVLWFQFLGFSDKAGLVGSLSLVIIMLPIVVRSTEEMLKLVPMDLREASYALGVPKWRTIVKIVLPTALGGIITGVMLALARIMGETAPLLLLVGVNRAINFDPFSGTMATLPTYIYQYFGLAAGNQDSPQFHRAWAAALVLIVLIMLINLIARLVARFSRVGR